MDGHVCKKEVLEKKVKHGGGFREKKEGRKKGSVFDVG